MFYRALVKLNYIIFYMYENWNPKAAGCCSQALNPPLLIPTLSTVRATPSPAAYVLVRSPFLFSSESSLICADDALLRTARLAAHRPSLYKAWSA
jgi:hypothetical protein